MLPFLSIVSGRSSFALQQAAMSLSDSHYFDDVTPRKFDEMRKLLDSSDTRQKLESMKRLIALISMGKDASVFYPDVIKNVICPNLDVKKLVYVTSSSCREIL